MDEKREFSERLRTAMKAQKLEVSGPVLEREFNLRWSGNPVRRQTVWKWLNGEAIPTQDKLQELAKWLKLDPQRLRFGDHVQRHLRAEQKRWDEGVGYLERETFDAFLKLPAPQRKIVREVILAFAKVHASTDAPDARGKD
ncbi:MAG: transcriptional regulator [Polaromonas sp.]|nr:transcriptional regulator [Polaromonas sp.]